MRRQREKPIKVFLVNQAFYPDVVSTAQYLTDLAVDLVGRGCQVTVLAGRRGYAEPHPLYPRREVYRGIRVIRVCRFQFGRRNRMTRILDALLINLAFMVRMAFLPRFDRVVALTTPPMVAFSALLFTRLRGGRLVYWMMDLNPDQAIEAGWIRRDGRRARLLEWVLRLVLENSEGIVALDRFMKDRVIARCAPEERIKVLPLWAHNGDLETVPHDQNPFRTEHQLRDKFVVMYSGNLSVCHPLDTLLEAARLLKDDTEVVFLYIGGGERVGDVLCYREREQLSNVIYLDYLPRSEIKYSLSAADAHVVVMGDNYPGVVHTCKIYGILKIGRPFIYIGPERSHIGEIMAGSGLGYRVDNGNPAGVVEAMEEIRRMDDNQLENVFHQSRELARNRFSRPVLARRLVDFILGDDNIRGREDGQ
jgi:colanic acid biosynthesis glycosyl transferase WcaI